MYFQQLHVIDIRILALIKGNLILAAATIGTHDRRAESLVAIFMQLRACESSSISKCKRVSSGLLARPPLAR